MNELNNPRMATPDDPTTLEVKKPVFNEFREPVIKEIYIEAKKSKNFQTYTVGMTADVDTTLSEEDLRIRIVKIQAKCRQLCMEQIKIDGN